VLDALMEPQLSIQADTVCSDTQGQSAVVFAFARVFGIRLLLTAGEISSGLGKRWSLWNSFSRTSKLKRDPDERAPLVVNSISSSVGLKCNVSSSAVMVWGRPG